MLLIVIDTSWQYVDFLIAFGMYCQLFIVAVFLSWRFIATHGTNNLVTRLSTVWYLHAHLLLSYVFPQTGIAANYGDLAANNADESDAEILR